MYIRKSAYYCNSSGLLYIQVGNYVGILLEFKNGKRDSKKLSYSIIIVDSISSAGYFP